MLYKPNIYIALCSLLYFTSFAESISKLDGKGLFESNCSSCHTWDKEIIGPALGSIGKKREQEWIVDFVKSSQHVIQKGDAHAIFIFEQYRHNVMPDFDELSEQEILSIIAYLQKESENNFNASVPDHYDPALTNPEVLHGRQLFENLCVGCHALRNEVFGPALASVTKTRPREWLHHFIRNSKGVIDSGDPYAQFLYEQYDKKRMYAFNDLKSEDIDAILLYIKVASEAPAYIQGVNGRYETIYKEIRADQGNLYSYPHQTKSDFQALRNGIGLLMALIVSGLFYSLVYFFRILSV